LKTRKTLTKWTHESTRVVNTHAHTYQLSNALSPHTTTTLSLAVDLPFPGQNDVCSGGQRTTKGTSCQLHPVCGGSRPHPHRASGGKERPISRRTTVITPMAADTHATQRLALRAQRMLRHGHGVVWGTIPASGETGSNIESASCFNWALGGGLLGYGSPWQVS
jgi:hypothetical protein